MHRFFLTLFLGVSTVLLAQQKPPSQAEIERMMREAEKQANAMQNDPELKKVMKNASLSGNAFEDLDVPWGSLPSKNTKALSSLPAEILTSGTLRTYLETFNTRLFQSLSPEVRTKLNEIRVKLNNDPLAISRSAVMAWYSNSPRQALALASASATSSQTNLEVLNTFAALLNLCGLEQKAIPVLQFLDARLPGNATILNNLGQSFLGLGDLARAEQYLLKSTSAVPNHVEANRSLGLIYHAKGLTAKAASCFQRSLEGGYSPTTVAGAHRVHLSDESIDRFIILQLTTVKTGEYFNSYKYQVPPLCESVEQAAQTEERHRQFQEFLEAEIDKYQKLQEEESKKIMKNVSGFLAQVNSGQTVGIAPSPLFEKAKRMYEYWMNKYAHFMQDEIGPAMIKMSKKEYELYDQYTNEYATINISKDNGDKCARFDALANQYLPKYAANQREFMDKMLTPLRGYVDELIYWSQYLDILGTARSQIFGIVEMYLRSLRDISKSTKFIQPSCQPATTSAS